jgi:TonB family protein
MSRKTIKVCLTMLVILAGTFGEISQLAFCAPIPTPGLTPPMMDWCERFYWAILNSWAKNNHEIKNTSCVFNVQRNGDISNIRISKSSGSGVVDQEAISVLKQASPLPDYSFTGRPLKPFKEQPEIFVHFETYPVLRLTMEDSGLPMLQAPWGKSPNPVSVSCIFTMGTKGEIGGLRIFKPSGSDAIDRAVLLAIKSENPPFEKLLAPLHSPHEIVIEFYPSGDISTKLKEDQNLVPIGRSGQIPAQQRPGRLFRQSAEKN